MDSFRDYVRSLSRKKPLATISPSPDHAVTDNSFPQIMFLATSYIVGAGIFVLAGDVVHSDAGSAAAISYLLAGLIGSLSGLCYAEFDGMVPVQGSTYVYTYAIVGELWAYAVAWTMVLEYLINAAAAAKAWSGTLDSLCNFTITSGILSTVGSYGTSVAWLNPYPDFVAFGAVITMTICVCFTTRLPVMLLNVLAAIKIATVAIIIGAGFSLADSENWSSGPDGSFAPHGTLGVLRGTALCFFAYIGFDYVITFADRNIHTKRGIVPNFLLPMGMVTSIYVLVAIVLTLMVPYYAVVPVAPFTSAFLLRGMTWASYTGGIGILFGVLSVTFFGLYSLPRLIYAMSVDGLIFDYFSKDFENMRAPRLVIIATGAVSAVLAMFLRLDSLVQIVSTASLLKCIFIDGCVIILRYDPEAKINLPTESMPLTSDDVDYDVMPSDLGAIQTFQRKITLRLTRHTVAQIVVICTCIMTGCLTGLLLVLIFADEDVMAAEWWTIFMIVITSLGVIVPLIVLLLFEQVPRKISTFKTPLVPLVPLLGMACNITLMLMIDSSTWLNIAMWYSFGLIIYFVFSHGNSKVGKPDPTPETDTDVTSPT